MDGVSLFREENLTPTAYNNVKAYASSPWSNSANTAQIRNFQTSSLLTPCGPECTFDAENCPKAPVTWKGTKVSKIQFGADGAVQLRISVQNNKKPIDIRKNKYTAFMMVRPE